MEVLLYLAVSVPLILPCGIFKGKVYGQPLYRLLGGKHRDTLKAYASQLQNGWGVGRKTARTPADYARQAEIAVEKGLKQ